MGKAFKKILYIFVGLVGLVILSGVLVPIIFKEDIKAVLDEQIEANIDAKVVYDISEFGITIFKDFPNLTVKIGDFGVISHAPFEGDTLAMVEEFGVTLDLMSVIGGETLSLKKIYIESPTIKILSNSEGVTNYDITKQVDSTAVIVEELEEDTNVQNSESLSIKLEHWEITNARIVYVDQLANTAVVMNGFNHFGNGTIGSVYDINIKTTIDDLSLVLEGDSYYSKSTFDSDISAELDLENMKFELKQNRLQLNAFVFGFDGWVEMLNEDINLDLTFEAKENTFRNILSLVPGVFMEGFDDLKTEGVLAFDGFAKGTYNDNVMPSFGLNLLVKDAMVQYPDLPAAVSNINVDLNIDNPNQHINQLGVNLKSFHLDLGKNPIDAMAEIVVIDTVDLSITDAKLDVSINLAEIMSFYPVDEIALKGQFDLHAKAEGMYSDEKSLLPTLKANMKLSDGWVKSEEYNVVADNMTCNARLMFKEDLKASDTLFVVDHFGLSLDGERFESSLKVWDLDDISWDFILNGNLDLEKLITLAPIEGMTLKGNIAVNELRSVGKLSAIDNDDYAALETHGSAVITEFLYADDEVLPQGLKITESTIKLSPKAIVMKSYNGFIGNSDMQMAGEITNYMGYASDFMKDTVTPHGTLAGKLNYRSAIFDTAEWLDTTDVAGEEAVITVDYDAQNAALGMSSASDYAVPKNISFVMNAKIDQILYDNMVIEKANGDLIIKDGIVNMSDLSMLVLDGKVVMDGKFDTYIPEVPKFDFGMKIDKMKFKEVYNTFNTVKTIAPIAKKIEGSFGTDMRFAGPLDNELMPVYGYLDGKGIIEIHDAALKDVKIFEKISAATKFMKTSEELTIKDTKVNFEVIDGKTFIEPFEVKMGESAFTLGGSRSLDSVLDLDIVLDIKMDQKVGSQVNSLLSDFGAGDIIGDQFTLPIKVTGKESNPKVKILSIQSKNSENKSLKNGVKDQAKEEIEKQKAKAKEELNKHKEEQKKNILDDAQRQADKIKSEGRIQGKKAKEEGYKQADALVKKAKNPWEKAGAKLGADKVRKESDRSEKRIIDEANKRADDLMRKAREKASAI